MSKGRTWLYVFRGPRAPQFTVYHDDPPTTQTLKQLPALLHRWEITGTVWVNRSLSEIEDEYHRRVARGDLPPDTGQRPLKRAWVSNWPRTP